MINKIDVVGRVIGAAGYLAQAYIERQNGLFGVSMLSVNRAVETILFGQVRIPANVTESARHIRQDYEQALMAFRKKEDVPDGEGLTQTQWARFDAFYNAWKRDTEFDF